jgi:hypothetical protein
VGGGWVEFGVVIDHDFGWVGLATPKTFSLVDWLHRKLFFLEGRQFFAVLKNVTVY